MWIAAVFDASGSPPSPAGEGLSSEAGRGRVVLIVDGDAGVRELVTVALTGSGYRVEGCANGRDAMNHLRSHTDICVILLDLMLPAMAAAQFRAAQLRDRSLAWIPVIAISGSLDAMPDAERLGARALVRKPIDLDQLKETLHQVGFLHTRHHTKERRSPD
jgi:CheY-like chemotaxis protein